MAGERRGGRGEAMTMGARIFAIAAFVAMLLFTGGGTALAGQFLKRLPEFWEGAELVRLHHERYDATGYPRGIGGADLPWEASIIAVADAWDAMTRDRPYRRALSRDEAVGELLRFRGTQWAPLVVDAFLGMLEEERRGTRVAAVAAVAQ